MALFDNTSFRMIEQGLNATWYKKSVIQQNIANDSTPGYKAKTVHFKELLTNVENDMKAQIMGKAYKRLDLATYTTIETGTEFTMDGNNVDMEKEQVALADVQLQYEALANKASAEFRMIRSAIAK